MKVHELLNNPSKWTKHRYAINTVGDEVDADNPEAVAWNLSGAINYCYFLSVPSALKTEKYKAALAEKMHKINEIIGTPNAWDWQAQQERTFEELQSVIIKVDI